MFDLCGDGAEARDGLFAGGGDDDDVGFLAKADVDEWEHECADGGFRAAAWGDDEGACALAFGDDVGVVFGEVVVGGVLSGGKEVFVVEVEGVVVHAVEGQGAEVWE